MTQDQVPAGTVVPHILYPLRVIASENYPDFASFVQTVVPSPHIDSVMSVLFFKLWRSGLTITMPTREEVKRWQDTVAEHGHGQLVMDCTIHYFHHDKADQGEFVEITPPMHGGAVLTYTRVTEEGSRPRGYHCQLSFHT